MARKRALTVRQIDATMRLQGALVAYVQAFAADFPIPPARFDIRFVNTLPGFPATVANVRVGMTADWIEFPRRKISRYALRPINQRQGQERP